MAYRKITPSTYLVFIDLANGTDFVLLGCLTSHSFSINNNEIDAKSMCGPDKLPGTQDIGLSMDGQLILSPDVTEIGHYDMLVAAQNKTNFSWKIGKAVPIAGDVTITGKGFLSGYDNSFDADNPATFSATVGVVGSPVIVEAV